ncbi:MAG TPA: SpoVR family protein, partial [Azospirillaceae bacterium]|nr:SpoVR family protein [Azospirillaceae bacterium]
VERVLDAAHALMSHGVHRYPRKRALDLRGEERRERERREYRERIYNDLWRTVPKGHGRVGLPSTPMSERKKLLGLPEENLLYFLEKMAPRLKQWQREILRIVRHIAQYFYPQKQTKVMNEGCATWVHYTIMNRLHEKGLLTDGAMLEFLHSHTSVVFQPDFDDPRFSGINPYALGFGMMEDIKRICTTPTDEDRAWFPDIAGNQDPTGTLREAWANYRDESFVQQFLSPHLIRKMRLIDIHNDAEDPFLLIQNIHNERGYRSIRKAMAKQYDLAHIEPDIQIVDVDLEGDRRLVLQHRVHNGIMLEESDAKAVLRHIANLWGYEVVLAEVSATSEAILKEHAVTAPSAVIH